MGERDMSDGDIVVSPAGGTLSILLASADGTVSGTVLDADDKPAASVTALIAPKGRPGRQDLLRFALTDGAGNFRITNVPPGDYIAVATEEELPSVTSEDFLRHFESRIASVAVSSAAVLKLKLITAGEFEEAKWTVQ
jgi:hypothetical protein